ncbi:hypothetical protein GGE67_003632 [Rhizobium leucaenae]|uniref:Uncharacterized protein n=1 Tax=Rhizobium leucaenae TaxID=29450 RepID=A0A7W7EM45_9HYPH|nr:hypothetical protein [Rhizobium leucaenae]MBB6303007.1 hypothetical protein [Rhizobium leucaenae]
MLRTMDLDDQSRFETYKVQDIAIEWNLPFEF